MKRQGNFKGGKREKAQLTYSYDIYNYSTLSLAEPLTEKEARKEYSRLRSIARKRLERLEKSEFKESATYLNNKDRFTPLPEIKNIQELYKKLADVARFVKGERSKISGLKNERKKALETLKERGYGFINKDNFKAFTEFMDEMRAQKLAESYDSGDTYELFVIATKKKITSEEIFSNFQLFLDNKESLAKMKTVTNKTRISSDEILKKLRK